MASPPKKRGQSGQTEGVPPSEGAALPVAVRSSIAQWLARLGGARLVDARSSERETDDRERERKRRDGDDWEDWLTVNQSTASLLGSEAKALRSRMQIYQTWQDMGYDPVICTALRLHTTSALGGHETRGEMVFIEPADSIADDPNMQAFVKGIAVDLQAILNRIAPQVCVTACQYGDSYGRIYSQPGFGVQDVYVDELVMPGLIQPYERGNTTVGFVISTGQRVVEKLSLLQMARMRMPRMLYIPQERVTWKAWKTTLKTDDIRDLPVLPALAGGSFLDGAETAWKKFTAAWAGLTGQRVRDSIKQTIVTVQQNEMTKKQRATLKSALATTFAAMNAYVTAVVQAGVVPMTELFHFLPVSGEKQMVTLNERASASASGSSMTIDDVMMNARFLAGALGVDLSMLGFGDQLSGGLGDGGFFRLSAHAAERARMIRAAFSEFANHIIKVHCIQKHGLDFGDRLPWRVEYAGGISAYETEQARTRADKMNATALMVQTLAQMKDLGLDVKAMVNIMTNMMGLDRDQADLLAKSLEKAIKDAKAQQQAEASMGGGGGGFGGGAPGGPMGIEPSENGPEE